jgi:hypothetical protein
MASSHISAAAQGPEPPVLGQLTAPRQALRLHTAAAPAGEARGGAGPGAGAHATGRCYCGTISITRARALSAILGDSATRNSHANGAASGHWQGAPLAPAVPVRWPGSTCRSRPPRQGWAPTQNVRNGP